MSSEAMKEILAEARKIYEKTQCDIAGCCGDFDGAIEYIDGAVAELIQQTIEDVVVGASN